MYVCLDAVNNGDLWMQWFTYGLDNRINNPPRFFSRCVNTEHMQVSVNGPSFKNVFSFVKHWEMEQIVDHFKGWRMGVEMQK